MSRGTNIESAPVAHDGDWYYFVPESDLELANKVAGDVFTRRTRFGRYLAGKQLRNLITTDIDCSVDDTSLEYFQSAGFTNRELAEEVQKATVISESPKLYF